MLVHDLLSFVIHLCKKTPNLKCMSIKYWRFFVWTCQRKCFTLDLFYTWRKFLLISRWCWKMQKNSHIQKALCTFEFGNFNFLIFLNEMQSFSFQPWNSIGETIPILESWSSLHVCLSLAQFYGAIS